MGLTAERGVIWSSNPASLGIDREGARPPQNGLLRLRNLFNPQISEPICIKTVMPCDSTASPDSLPANGWFWRERSRYNHLYPKSAQRGA